jgi:hypothetical protein
VELLPETISGPDQVTAKVSFDGNGNVQTVVLKNFNGEWKIEAVPYFSPQQSSAVVP